MYGKIKEHLQQELAEIKAAGLYKSERVIESPQRAEIEVAGRKALNFCANNYLGLSDNPRLIEAAKRAMDNRGYGMSSVRFICGCQDIHKQLEKAIADYFGTEDTILYAACFDANGGVFEPIFGQEDAIISDSLNHASIIDGVRLCKAVRYRYANADMAELEECLKQAQAQRFRIICTDGGLLDGRQCRTAGQDLRIGREIRRAGDGGRVPLGGRAGQNRPRHHRTLRPARSGGHPHRHARQSLRRRRRRLHDGPQGDYRDAPPAFAPLPLLQLAAPPPSSAPESRCSACWAKATNCTTVWWPTWSTSAKA